MKNLLKLTLAAGALIAFSGAQAEIINAESCTAVAPAIDLVDGSATNAANWGAGTYGSDGSLNGGDCWETNVNSAVPGNASGNAIINTLMGSTGLTRVWDSTSPGGSIQTSVEGDTGNGEKITIATNVYDCSAADSCALLIKDGKTTPAQYLFDLSGWDGSSLDISRLFVDNGRISGYQFYAGSATVPEPMTLLLLGAGLVGFGVRRKFMA